MDIKKRAVLLVVIATLFASSAQILYKIGARNLPGFSKGFGSFMIGLLTNYPLIGGLLLYGVGAVLLIIALKNGDLSVLYPIIALSYIWVSILSIFFLQETMGALKWAGILCIVFGVSLIGAGSKGKKTKHKRSEHEKARRNVKLRDKKRRGRK